MYSFHSLTKTLRSRLLLLAAAITLAGYLPAARAAFDPVNDDTDIFLANPNVTAERPNVIIFVDNTANWNTAFTNEKSALVSVVQNLNDFFNVGLVIFPETGGDNDNVDGAYVRFAVRQMTSANKTVLASIVNSFDKLNDKGNNSTPALGMAELYQYFAGLASRSSFGKIKTDFQNNTLYKLCSSCSVTSHPSTAASLGNYALNNAVAGSKPGSGTLFNSPITDGCQNNFIIYISNGPGADNSSANTTSQGYLSALGYDTSTSISITPNGNEGNWMDEWAKFMANADVNASKDGNQHVYTYTVEVDPGTQLTDQKWTAVMKSVASQGRGKYFAVSSGNSGQAIINALNQIFQEVQAVNSVFASTTLPVSVNVRGTNLNQVYIGVFRPDEGKAPRWYGNVKLYELGFDATTNSLFLADSSGTEAENPATGFINATATSFWTTSSTFWGFRSSDENGSGGSSDLPDGDLVEKGGVAEQERKDFPTSQSTRKLYTCTSGTVICTDGSELKDTPFDTTNDGVNNTNLQLATISISTLTGFVSQSVSGLTDTRSVSSASTASGGVAVTALSTSGVTTSVTSLSTSTARSISVMSNGAVNQTASVVRQTGNPKVPVTATTSSAHNLGTGQTVYISDPGGSSCGSDYVGTFAITVTDSTHFTYTPATSNPSAGTQTCTITTTTSVVTVTTSVAHGFTDGQSVTIAGVTPSSFNGTYNVSVTSTTKFSFTTAAALPPITSVSGATATGLTTTATATTASAHNYSVSDTVTIAGVTSPSGTYPNGYNGLVTITAVPTSTTFQYTVSTGLAAATGTITSTKGGTTVTALAPGHTFSNGDVVTISGANPGGYNGTYTITGVNTSVPGAETFQYTTASPQGANTSISVIASSGQTSTVTASVAGHQFGTSGTVQIDVSGATGGSAAAYNGTNITATIVDANTLTYDTVDGTSAAPATGTVVARLHTATAFATVTGHGYSTGDTVTISGATPTGYNLSDVTITVIDANTFSYPLSSSALGTATGTIKVSKKTTTAYAYAVNHGFTTGDLITVAGASPTAFNVTNKAVTVVDSDHFTYTLPSAQGDASGTLVASSGTAASSAKDLLVNWVRGADNQEDENADSSTTDIRASIHGDVLHSRPAVVNYNRFGNDDDVYVFYGGNDGVFRAIKGGFNQADSTEPLPGHEAWGFIPEEFFSKLSRLRNDSPLISSSNKKPYFADGTIGVYTDDTNNDGKLVASDGDKVWLFISMRRGGRFIYALDVSDPSDPKLLWKIDNSTTGFSELGYTWSAPNVYTLAANSGKPVLIFGGGYDPTVEDVDPSTITAVASDKITAAGSDYVRGMGRAIYVVDAETGTLLWEAGPTAPGGTPSYTFKTVSGMDYDIPSDITVIADRNSSVKNRAYVGDAGGNIWRIDMDSTTYSNWKVTKLASVADTSDIPGGLRKFLFPPDVVYSEDGYDAVLLGSGDREHPFDEDVVNRMYMFKDTGTQADTPIRGTGSTTGVDTTIVESDLFDATSNCIQDSSACDSSSGQTPATALSELQSADGWYVTLGEGEKVVGNAVTLNSVTFFNTNQPSTVSGASSTDCTSDLGTARQYQILFSSAEAIEDKNIDGSTDALDRSSVHAGGGYLPSPVPVVVEIDGKTHEGVISGVSVTQPPGSILNARLRKFWYKEMEDK